MLEKKINIYRKTQFVQVIYGEKRRNSPTITHTHTRGRFFATIGAYEILSMSSIEIQLLCFIRSQFSIAL